MTIRMTTAIRTARAQVILAALDAGAGAGSVTFWTGGMPDMGRDVSALAAHATATGYSAGDYVTAAGHYYRAENSGTSDASAPVWPTDGGTVADNDITWQDMGETPLLLGTLGLSSPAGAVVDGVLTLDDITEDSAADTNGTVTWCRLSDGDGQAVFDLSVGVIGSGEPIEINTTAIVAEGPLRMPSFVLTEPGI